jgi:hypothetical protein
MSADSPGMPAPKRRRPGNHNSDNLAKNRFAGLCNDLDISGHTSDEEYSLTTEGTENNQSKISSKSRRKIPPIVLSDNIVNHKEFVNKLNTLVTEQLSFKYKKDRVLIMVQNEDDHQKIIKFLKDEKMQFHTFTPASQYEPKFVIKNLPSNVSASEIMQELKDTYKLNVSDVVQLVKKENDKIIAKFPVYVAKFGKDTTFHDVLRATKVCHCVIKWEKYLRKNPVTQCSNCLAFGHIARNCFKASVCGFCAESHRTYECMRKNETDVKPKCSNCSKAHPANSKKCKKYEEAESRRNMRFNTTPAPQRQKTLSFAASKHYFPSLPRTANVSSSGTTTRAQESRPAYAAAATKSAGGRRHAYFSGTEVEDEEEVSLSTIVREVYGIVKDLNITKLLHVVKMNLHKLREASNVLDKVMVLVEIFMHYSELP